MKRITWISAALAASMALPMLIALGGCHHDHHEDRDGRAGNWERRDRYDNDRHDENRDADRHDDERIRR